MYRVFAIGNPVMDIIETPFGSTNGRVLSGCSTNAALTVGKLGYRSAFVGRAGNDYKDEIIRKASERNVDAYIIKDERTAGFHLRYLDEDLDDRELRIIAVAGKIEEIPEETFDSEAIIIAPVLQEVPLSLVKSVSDSYDSLITMDVQGFIRRLRGGKVERYRNPEVFEAMRLVDVAKPNEHEAAVIFPGLDPIQAAKRLSEINRLPIGIVTLDGNGSIVYYDGSAYHIPAYPVKRPKDPTGCGDVYLGAFTHRYLKTEDPIESAAFASAAASYMVEHIGPDRLMENIEERFERVYDHVKSV